VVWLWWCGIRMQAEALKCFSLHTDVCWCYVVVWLWWCGIRMQAEALKYLSLHTDTTPPQPNHNVTPTHIEPEQYSPLSNSTN